MERLPWKVLVCVASLGGVTRFASAEAKYRIEVKGVQSGQASLEQKLLPDGGKSVQLTMTIRQGDNRIVVKTQTIYGKSGQVSHAEQRIFPFGKPAVKEVSVDFDASGAKISTLENGETAQSTVPLKPTWPVSNASIFWFLGVTPEAGDVVKTFMFNLDTLKWERCVTTFEGKTHKGNLVRLEKEGQSVETAYDDDGYPHSIEDSKGVKMERI